MSNKLDSVEQNSIRRIFCEDVRYSKEERFSVSKQEPLGNY
jgi:hypothetical protein